MEGIGKAFGGRGYPVCLVHQTSSHMHQIGQIVFDCSRYCLCLGSVGMLSLRREEEGALVGLISICTCSGKVARCIGESGWG